MNSKLELKKRRTRTLELPVVRSRLKRLFDVLFSFVVLSLGVPVLLFIGLLIKLESRGPIIFRQQRVGLGGDRFWFLKFRTMWDESPDDLHRRYVSDLIRENSPYAGADKESIYKVTDDPRVTRFGRFLRRTCLDELPQFWNVLRGEMSVVGPRPPLPYEVEQYDDHHFQRLAARPGITGLWQVSGRSRLSFEEMVRLDVEYLTNWSFALDLKIIARTLPELLGFNRNGF